MIPQDFVKEYARMCKTYFNHMSGECKGCPLENKICTPSSLINNFHPNYFAEAYNEVEKWSDTHPLKTRQSELLKMFPDAKLVNKVLDICPKNFERDFLTSEFLCNAHIGCKECLKNYWLGWPEEEEK